MKHFTNKFRTLKQQQQVILGQQESTGCLNSSLAGAANGGKEGANGP
jgi:hypothetical protein